MALWWKKKNNITSSVYDCTVEDVEYIYNRHSILLLLDVYTELVIDVFYIFNSTVIDWTCYIFFSNCTTQQYIMTRASHWALLLIWHKLLRWKQQSNVHEKRKKDGFLATWDVSIPLAHNKTLWWKSHFIQLKLVIHVTVHKNSVYTLQRTVTVSITKTNRWILHKKMLFTVGSIWKTKLDYVKICGCFHPFATNVVYIWSS